MRVGDVASPSALLRAPVPEAGEATPARSRGPLQRAFLERRPHRVPETPAREERRREPEEHLAEAPRPAVSALHAPEFELRQELDGLEFGASVDFAAAYHALRSFSDEEHLDVGDDYGAVGNDERVRNVLRALEEASAARDEGVADRAASFETAEPPESGLRDFAARLSSRQAELEAEAQRLGGVVSALRGGADTTATSEPEAEPA